MRISKQIYFQKFIDYLKSLEQNEITMNISEIRELLGKDSHGNWILCDTANQQVFWSYDQNHRFPYYLRNNGWRFSSHFVNGKKEITFTKTDSEINVNSKERKPETIKGININSFI